MKYIKLFEEYNEDENDIVKQIDLFKKDEDDNTDNYYCNTGTIIKKSSFDNGDNEESD